MNEKSNDNNIAEEEMNELPGYIQSIINDFYSFDKKDTQNKQDDTEINQDLLIEDKKEIKSDNETIIENNKKIEENENLNKEEIENIDNDLDMDFENIFN